MSDRIAAVGHLRLVGDLIEPTIAVKDGGAAPPAACEWSRGPSRPAYVWTNAGNEEPAKRIGAETGCISEFRIQS